VWLADDERAPLRSLRPPGLREPLPTHAPTIPTEGDWTTLRPSIIESVLEELSAYAPNIRSAIVESLLITPADMEERLGLTFGNIRHLDIMPGQMLGSRPLPGWGYRTPVGSLYLCGAGTHPGGDVTGMPGHNAAHAILQDLQAA
jgi:phytoene dehydrogenase-like protein